MDFAPDLVRCPRALILESDADVMGILGVYDAWKRLGVLPWPGDIGAQPAWLADAFLLVSTAEEEASAMRDAERESRWVATLRSRHPSS